MMRISLDFSSERSREEVDPISYWSFLFALLDCSCLRLKLIIKSVDSHTQWYFAGMLL